MRTGDRGDDAAAVDVADQHDRHVGAGGKAHIGDVARPEVYLGRRPCTLDDDEVGALAHLGPGIEHRIHQLRLQKLVVARPGLAEHLALHDDLAADVALRLQQHRVHVDRGRGPAGDGLQPLRAADLAAAGLARNVGDGGVVRHVLRLERADGHAAVLRGAAEAGDKHGLADIRAGALEHDRASHGSAPVLAGLAGDGRAGRERPAAPDIERQQRLIAGAHGVVHIGRVVDDLAGLAPAERPVAHAPVRA